jgi:hypothetical protein
VTPETESKRNRLSVGARPSAPPVTAHWLQIFPPNQTVPIYLHFTSTACAKPVRLLTVNVVVPGRAAEPRRGAGSQALPASVPPVTSIPPEVTGGTPPGPPVYPAVQGQERCQQRSPGLPHR